MRQHQISMKDCRFLLFVFPEILLYSLPLFLDMCPLGMCEQAHHPSAFMLPPGLLGRPVGTLSVNRGHLRTACDKTRSELWRMPSFQLPFLSFSLLSAGRCDAHPSFHLAVS